MAFGVLLVKAGYPWYLAPLMSILMYAGSGQLLAVGFFLNDPGLAGIVLATALVQMRHLFYGLSLLRPFLSFGRSRWYMMHALTDETYALLTGLSAEERADERLCLLVCGLDHLWWILGGLLGALAGSLLPWNMKGLEFTLTALFTVLALRNCVTGGGCVPV
jgi:4-azaleucine resistance transporter AzlC